MFITALFIIGSKWKQLKYLPAVEWINKLLYIQTMEDHAAVKKSKLLILVTIWRNLKVIILTGKSQT